MPNLTQKAYSQNLSMAYRDGQQTGEALGYRKANEETRGERAREIVSILREAALLAQANAQLTYALHMLVEKAAKNG